MPIASRCEKSPSTFLSPSSCGFARVAALELGRRVSAELLKEEKEGQVKFCARKLQEHYKRYIELFKEQDGDFQIDLTKFRKKLPPLQLQEHYKRYIELFKEQDGERPSSRPYFL